MIGEIQSVWRIIFAVLIPACSKPLISKSSKIIFGLGSAARAVISFVGESVIKLAGR